MSVDLPSFHGVLAVAWRSLAMHGTGLALVGYLLNPALVDCTGRAPVQDVRAPRAPEILGHRVPSMVR
jgi:hypothetical protein